MGGWIKNFIENCALIHRKTDHLNFLFKKILNMFLKLLLLKPVVNLFYNFHDFYI